MRTNRQPIIVVDDDASMSLAIERLLGAAGLHVVTFGSAEALLESGAAGDAACFVFDVALPGLSGFELRSELVRLGNAQPVIFITAQDESSSRENAKSLGASGYFPKPFPGREFVGVVTKACETATN